MTDNPYGMTSFNFSATTNTEPLSQIISDMQALGLTWLRYQVPWKLVETPQGTYTWTALDTTVSACNAAGINIDITLQNPPTWALTTASQQFDTVPQYAPDPTLMAGFASQVATRYNGAHGYGTIQAIELGNEDFNSLITPVGTGNFGTRYSPYAEYNGLGGVTTANIEPGSDPHYFVAVLVACSNAIRAVAPAMKIGIAAITWSYAPNVADFLAGLYAELPTAGNYYDFANLHYYPGANDPYIPSATELSLPQTWAAMQATMQAAGDLKPIWITEFGWLTNNNGTPSAAQVTQIQQSSFYQEFLENVRLSNGAVQKVFLYTLEYVNNDNYSLVHKSGATLTYLPAFTTLQNYIAQYPTWPDDTALFPPAKRRGSANANAYAPTVLADAPLIYARLGDTDATAFDSSGNHHDGTPHGVIGRQKPGLIVNDPNKSMQLDGATNWISFPTTGLPTGAGAWSLEVWTKITSIASVGAAIAFGTFASGEFAEILLSNATFTFSANTETDMFASTNVTVGSIHHLVATYDGTTVTLYQDGYAVNSAPYTLNIVAGFAYLGARETGPTRFYSGYLQECAWYSSCLTPQQVLNHYQVGTIGLSGSVALFPSAKRRG